jgi:GTP-binding protein HflX
LSAKAIDRAAPVQSALVIHPVRGRHAGSRGDAARLTEAVGLAEALDLRIEEAMLTPLRSPSPATLFGSGRVAEIAEPWGPFSSATWKRLGLPR